MSYRLTPQATRDIARASAWWQENRPEAPSAVLDEVAKALEQVVSQPESARPTAVARRAWCDASR